MVMRKTIKKARAKLRPMAPSIWGKILSEFPEITNGTTFPGIFKHKDRNNLATCLQSFGNFKSYQVFPI